MKYILKTTLGALLLIGVVACNMDLRPHSVIDPDNALETYDDAEKLANGFNTQIRALSSGSIIYTPELQSDLFHAVADFGNRGGTMYRWEFSASEGIFESVFGACYSAIGNSNYFIEKARNVQERVEEDVDFAKTWSSEELDLLNGHISEAYFVKAYAYSILVDKFCEVYDSKTAGEPNTGVAIVDTYNPTPDKTKYPGRATLEDSFEEIYDDLDSAARYISNLREPEAGSNYITADAVHALRARVALLRGDYATAIQATQALIGPGRQTYGLVTGADNLKRLWLNDSQPREVILQCYASVPNELPASNCYGYIGYNHNLDLYAPDFVPEKWLLDLYSDSDYRKTVFFDEQSLTLSVGETDPVMLFNKFPGNPALSVSETVRNYCNAPKPFRIAEIYLIAAEAYAGLQQIELASGMLNTLRKSRIEGWQDKTYNLDELREEIRKERVRELAGEGFRMSDLKRYGEGMTRHEAQIHSIVSVIPNEEGSVLLNVPAGDYRFVWAIPQVEIDANPNMVQNEGYTN